MGNDTRTLSLRWPYDDGGDEREEELKAQWRDAAAAQGYSFNPTTSPSVSIEMLKDTESPFTGPVESGYLVEGEVWKEDDAV